MREIRRWTTPEVADQYVLNALGTSRSRLLSKADLVTDTYLDELEVTASLNRLVPEQVRMSTVRNRRGADLYAPSDRAPSKQEQRVGSKGRLGGFWRWWYLDFTGVRTCDL